MKIIAYHSTLFVVMNRDLLLEIAETSVGYFYRVSVEQSVQGVASGNVFVQNPEELGSVICPNVRIPGRVEPELSPAPTPVLFPSFILV